jgi:MFS family permease
MVPDAGQVVGQGHVLRIAARSAPTDVTRLRWVMASSIGRIVVVMSIGERGLSTTPLASTDTPDDGYPRKLLLTVIAGIVVFSSSMTIVSASLPTMAEDLGSTESFLAWAVTGLFLVMAVGTPILGRLGDVFGHRRLFLAGSIVLGIGTVLCGIAPTAFAFVAARMFVGLGIAATFPTAMALIMDAYPPSRRSEAMGWFQMAMTGAPVMGLIIGGPLIDAFGWRMLFAVLAPISLVGSTLAWKVIRPDPPRSASDERVTIDWAGAAIERGDLTLSRLIEANARVTALKAHIGL